MVVAADFAIACRAFTIVASFAVAACTPFGFGAVAFTGSPSGQEQKNQSLLALTKFKLA